MSLGLLQAPKQRQLDFIQAIRLLRQMGDSGELRLTAEPMPEGDPAEVLAVERLGSETCLKLGLEALSGARGVLPDYLYEELLSSLHDEEQALNDFLDLFNHRYYQLLQGVTEKGNLLLRDEQEQCDSALVTRTAQRQCLTQLSALPQLPDAETGLIGYSLLLGMNLRSLDGLRQLLCDYFELRIHVQATPVTRYRLPASTLSRIGRGGGAQNNRLGQGLLLGRSGEMNFHRLEILVEPADQAQYLSLQSDLQFAARLRQVSEAYLRERSELKLYLYVKRAFIAQPLLSSRPRAGVWLGEANCLAPHLRPEEYRKILLQ
ncbi:type VI secretion system baseplate subunit TssG [Marinobacterium jannaschii]|uniref:type VI secretion system baseplate subunit TssG n=1 Tax=Marinobacterium jannaschii TaxID=64970 RepID=UPI00047FD522|nr:type VI secretion system baseplate subunit TssG [Marinobacterium jannaschii]